MARDCWNGAGVGELSPFVMVIGTYCILTPMVVVEVVVDVVVDVVEVVDADVEVVDVVVEVVDAVVVAEVVTTPLVLTHAFTLPISPTSPAWPCSVYSTHTVPLKQLPIELWGIWQWNSRWYVNPLSICVVGIALKDVGTVLLNVHATPVAFSAAPFLPTLMLR